MQASIDTALLRATSSRLVTLVGNLEVIATSLPDGIPADAWSGPAARALAMHLPAAREHIRRTAGKVQEMADTMNRLAASLDGIEVERKAAVSASSPLDPLGLTGLTEDAPINVRFELASRGDAAKRKAAEQLRSISGAVQLTAHIAYVPPVAVELEDSSGMSADEKRIIALDLAGVVDPTGVADVTSALLSLKTGDVVGALLSAVGVVPLLGDSAKLLKHSDDIKLLDRGADASRLVDDGSAAARGVTHGPNIFGALSNLDDLAEYTRIANRSFDAGGYLFLTDDLGRTVVASGRLRRLDVGRSGLETAIGKMGEATDHGGHLIGARFGGLGLPFNVVPQSQFINQSVYKTIENEWDRLLKGGSEIDVSVTTTYDQLGTIRPDGFLIEYSVDGVEQPAQYFLNQQ